MKNEKRKMKNFFLKMKLKNKNNFLKHFLWIQNNQPSIFFFDETNSMLLAFCIFDKAFKIKRKKMKCLEYPIVRFKKISFVIRNS